MTTEPGQDIATLERYMRLPQGKKIQAEYIWIGGSGEDIRGKTRTLKGAVKHLSELPEWNFDGSSTNQAPGNDSEVWLRPVKMVPDPFRGGNNIIVLCDTLNPQNMQPIPTNTRAPADIIFSDKRVSSEDTWFGIEQEYTLFERNGTTPLGWPGHGNFPAPQGPYYCGVGTRKAIARNVIESHYRACLYAGLDISGINAEVMPGQWEFQVGPCVGVDSGDQLWLARYLLTRVAEDFGVIVSFAAKPIAGDWNGAGAHTNFSTKSMRINPKSEEAKAPENKGKKLGFDAVLAGIDRMAKKHVEHMKVYGSGNEARMLGTHETASFDKFSFGVANRGASVRIPRMTEINGFGYLEDRRPAANMDPYKVTSMIAKTVLM